MNDLRLAGYASVFGAPDGGGDIVRRGAFARELQKTTPLLWQHKADEPVGVVERLAEDATGLRVTARLADTARGRDVAALLRGGALDGLSFGYRVRAAAKAGPYRELTDLELIEVSLVTFPMQPRARVLAFTTEEMDG